VLAHFVFEELLSFRKRIATKLFRPSLIRMMIYWWLNAVLFLYLEVIAHRNPWSIWWLLQLISMF